jgi:hypothetical protein
MTPLRGLGVLVCLAALTACGNAYYWQQASRGQADFERDSGGCAADATRAPAHADKEQVYRACMRNKGWQRVQAEPPMPTQFRGPESDAEMTALPSPTSAPNEDAAATRCRLDNDWTQPRMTALTAYHECLKRRR